MAISIDRVRALQAFALGYALDALGLRDPCDLTSGRDPVAPASPAELEDLIAELNAENLALRIEVRELERRLYPSAAELEAWALEHERRRVERAAETRI